MKSFLTRIVGERQQSFVMFNGNTYCFTDHPSPNFFQVGHVTRLPLRRSLPCSLWEQQDDSLNRQELDTAVKDYILSVTDHEIKHNQSSKSNVALILFVMNEFLPYIHSRTYAVEDEILRELQGESDWDPVQQAKQEIQARLIAEFGNPTDTTTKDYDIHAAIVAKVQSELKRCHTCVDHEPPEADSLIEKITGKRPLYVNSSHVYFLRRQKTAPKSSHFVLNGNIFVPSRRVEISEVAEAVTQRRKLQWILESTKHHVTEIAEAQARIQAAFVAGSGTIIDNLVRRQEYDLGTCGFVFKDDQCLVYTRLPKFATQDSRNPTQFWPYEEMRIAITVGWRDGQAYSYGRPIVIEHNPYHPCLNERERKSGHCEICNLNRDPSDYRNTVLDMVRKLSDAANVVMRPLSKESLERHAGESYFGATLTEILKQSSLTREKAEKKGYAIVEVMVKER